MSQKELDGTDKAAILLMALDSDIAGGILEKLDQAEVDKVTRALVNIDNVASEQRREVVGEFYSMLRAQDYIDKGGMGKAHSLIKEAFGKDKAEDIVNRLKKEGEEKPFSFVRQASPGQIKHVLKGEHDQTIALVLSYLDKPTAAEILGELPDERQAKIARQIALMGQADPAMVREVEEALERRLSSVVNQSYAHEGGVENLVETIKTLGRSARESLLATIKERDPELAADIRSALFVFEDLASLSDSDLQAVLRGLDKETIVKALKGAEESIKQAFYNNMSERAESMVRDELAYIGSVRVSDVQEAREAIVHHAQQLSSDGKIIIDHQEGEGVVE